MPEKLGRRYTAAGFFFVRLLLFYKNGLGVEIATGAVTKYDRDGYPLELNPETAHNLQSLQKNARGVYRISSSGQAEAVAVHDEKSDLTLVFDKE